MKLSTCTTSARVVPSSSCNHTSAGAPSVTCTLNCVCSPARMTMVAGNGRAQ
ncbi:Uncharacterised protein [Mycobacterium tuberculosis]|nr:Uncharacterised protein [Mycobacterium tuberculosis]